MVDDLIETLVVVAVVVVAVVLGVKKRGERYVRHDHDMRVIKMGR